MTKITSKEILKLSEQLEQLMAAVGHTDIFEALEELKKLKSAKYEMPPLPEIDEDTKQFLQYNPNVDDIVVYIRDYAMDYAMGCVHYSMVKFTYENS